MSKKEHTSDVQTDIVETAVLWPIEVPSLFNFRRSTSKRAVSEVKILSAEVFSGGVIVDFADGISVVFTTEFLLAQRVQAEQLSPPAET